MKIFKFFSAKSEVCEVFSHPRVHVLVRQPRNHDDLYAKSNNTAGFLVYLTSVPDDMLEMHSGDTPSFYQNRARISDQPQEPIIPKIALLPPVGRTNERLVTFLRSVEGLSAHKISASELGDANRDKISKALGTDARDSILQAALQSGGSLKDRLCALDRITEDRIALLQVKAECDVPTLPNTLALLKDSGLVRPEIFNALKFVVGRIYRDSLGFEKPIRNRDLLAQVNGYLVPNA